MIWNIIPGCEERYKIDTQRCGEIVQQARTPQDVRDYLDDVHSRLQKGDKTSIQETWSVAVPLAYRLALDDTASGYQIISRLKEASLCLLHPQVMQAVSDEIDFLCRSAFGMGYAPLNGLRSRIEGELAAFVHTLPGDWSVYSSTKCASSILDKFTRFQSGRKSPKEKTPESLQRMRHVLERFEMQAGQRIAGRAEGKQAYTFDEVKFLLPDLLAFAVQRADCPGQTMKLDEMRGFYGDIYARLEGNFPATMIYGPSYSDKWHMNRLSCHMAYPWNEVASVPMELFIRNDVDYYIGYGNYWRYRGIGLFMTPEMESRDQAIADMASCKSFADVQERMFAEVKSL